MKPYPADLLDGRPADRDPAVLPDLPRVRSLFPRLHQEGQAALDWIAATVKTARLQDDDTIFDQLYRRGHVLAGMAALLRLPKADHLLAILDIALDLGRTLQTFERHSLDYVVSLLARSARGVLDDFHAHDRCDQDLSDVIDECRAYLAEPLRQRLQERQGAAGFIPAVPTAGRAPERVVAAQPGETRAEIDDGPEELRMPPDRAGLTSAFCEESRDSLAQVGHQLVELEQTPDPLPAVNALFRSVHTVKGGARLLQVRKMEVLAHRMESLLDLVRKGLRRVSPRLIDVLLDGKKLLEEMADEVASRGPIRTRIGPCLSALATLEAGQESAAPPVAPSARAAALAREEPREPIPTEEPKPEPAQPAPEPRVERPPSPEGQKQPETAAAQPGVSPTVRLPALAAESIRIPTEKLDDVLNTASEVFISRIRLASDVAALGTAIRHGKQTLQRTGPFEVETILDRLAEANRRLVNDLRTLLTAREGRVPPDRLAALVNRFHQELSAEVRQHSCSGTEELTLNLLSIDEVRKRLQKNVEHLEQLSVRLQTGAMSFRMVPITHLFDRFPTQVRGMARQVGKKVRLEVSGTDTELDKVLINQLADPLLHILRNAIDHGIESPEERSARGKPEAGHIALRASYQGSHAILEVADDGRGIDVERVVARAIENGLVDREKAAALSRPEAFQLIFEPGLSTADCVSTLSGRGVGMDVVRTALNQMQGTITVESAPNQGTTLRLKLPLTLAVVGILLVRERSHQFALPIQHVEEILMVPLADLQRVGGNTLYHHRGATLPVTTLSALLDFPPSRFTDHQAALVILSEGDRKVGVLVDAVLGRQEVLIKGLGSLIKKAPFVMGCTILSDSRLVLVLNAWEVVNARSSPPLVEPPPTTARLHRERKQHPVLIVDDSAMQRNYLGDVLGQAGYLVETADNGFEGLKRVRQRRFSAICVDVVMPLMDGFEFTERLRRLSGQADTPVLFITGRPSPSVRDRAAHLGVRAYFEKPVDADSLVRALDQCCLG